MTVTLTSLSQFSPVLYYIRGVRVISIRSWRLEVHSNGQLFISGSRVIVNKLMVGNVVVLFVDKPVKTALPSPILPGQCNLKQSHLFRVPWPRSCPKGSFKLNHNRWSKIVMCQRDTIIKKQCCPGFFGPTCEFHCPGPYRKPCNNNGVCFDGLKGDGKCLCKEPFSGLECELCSSREMYGSGCNKTCPCLYGVCDSGSIFSSGKCKRCNQGYRGELCDRRVILCVNSTLTCRTNEHCEKDSATMEPKCVCNDGYKKQSGVCSLHNPCLDPEMGFGRCHSEAICKYLKPGKSSCICRKGWYGDGVACEREWAQCKKAADCKTDGSVCVQGACQCANGRSFSNSQCLKKFNCEVNNGGCHPYAICLPDAPDRNSHCKCRENVAGDGFICLVSWNHAPALQEMDSKSQELMHMLMYRLVLKRRKRKTGKTGPYTIIYYTLQNKDSQSVTLDQKGDIDKMILDGLHFVPNTKDQYLTSDFFYPNATMMKLATVKQGNETYIEGSKLIHSNIYVKEGILHVVDKLLKKPPKSTPLAAEFTTQTPLPPTVKPAPGTAKPVLLAYPITRRDKDKCPQPFRSIKFDLTVRLMNSMRLNRRNPFRRFSSEWFDVKSEKDGKSVNQSMYFCASNSTVWPKGNYCLVPFFSKSANKSCPPNFSFRHHHFYSLHWRIVKSLYFSLVTEDPSMEEYVTETINSLLRSKRKWSECCRSDGENTKFPFKSFTVFKYNRNCPRGESRTQRMSYYAPYEFLKYFNYFWMNAGFLRMKVCIYGEKTNVTIPSAGKSSQLAYLVFNDDYCPKGQRNPFTSSFLIDRYPIFGISSKMNTNVSLCAVKNMNLWPTGYYCALKLNSSLPCPLVNGKELAYFEVSLVRKGPAVLSLRELRTHPFQVAKRTYYRGCCGKFGNPMNSKKSEIRKLRKKVMPSFALISQQSHMPCPKIPGYIVTRDVLRFRSVIRYFTTGTAGLTKCGNRFCFNLCHYSETAVFAFALPMPISGCEKNFLKGYRIQHLEKNDTMMPLHYINLAGVFKKDHNIIRLQFCVNIGKRYGLPRGSYCIYRKLGLCPPGFQSSYAEMDDEDDYGAIGSFGGVVPDGVFSKDSGYYFCCRNDSSSEKEVLFPFKRPFYLFKSPHSKNCQKVKGFREHHEILMLDVEDARKLGKPAVKINGSVPMTRSQARGVDVDVHYCFYDNRPDHGRKKKMGLVKYGPMCPENLPTVPKMIKCFFRKNCSNPLVNVCALDESKVKVQWPSGHYCLLKMDGVSCSPGFYKVPLMGPTKNNVIFDDPDVQYLCCRGRYVANSPPLNFTFIQTSSFALLAEMCPLVNNMRLSVVEDFSLFFVLCKYVPDWPNSIEFALPKIGSACPPEFKSSTIGQKYLKNLPIWDIFSNPDNLNNTKRIAALEICTKSPSGLTRKPWPPGKYCIFSSDKGVLSEFNIAISFNKNMLTKERMTSSFIFCRADGNVKLPDDIPWRYLAIPSLSSCPSSSSTKNFKLPLFDSAQINKNGFNSQQLVWSVGLPSESSFVPKKMEEDIYICVYKNTPDNRTIGFSAPPRINQDRKCKCNIPEAFCNDDNVCKCKSGFLGYGNNCIPCACGKYASCTPGTTSISSDCSCPMGFEGNGLFCSIVSYILPIKDPDPEISHWPKGTYSFIKTYDNIKKCPLGFTQEISRVVGRFEDVSFSLQPNLTMCSKKTDEGKKDWPDGNYCVWSRGSSCPTGLKAEDVYLPFQYIPKTDLDLFTKWGLLNKRPTVSVRFCCKSSDNDIKTIPFPPSSLFSLLRKGGKCPNLNQMTMIEQTFLFASGIDKFFVTINETPQDGTVQTNKNGPDLTWNAEKKSLLLHLCNYFITQRVAYPKRCNSTTTMLCQPQRDLYTVLTNEKSLIPLKQYLERCKYMDKIRALHHVQISLFIDSTMAPNSTGAKLKGVDCEFLDKSIVLSKWPVSIVLNQMHPGSQQFPTVTGRLATLVKTKSPNVFVLNNAEYLIEPLLYTKNGVIYQTKMAGVMRHRSGVKASRISYIVGGVVCAVFVFCIVAVLIWYFKRRNVSLSVSSFVNPVYYRPVEG